MTTAQRQQQSKIDWATKTLAKATTVEAAKGVQSWAERNKVGASVRPLVAARIAEIEAELTVDRSIDSF